MDLATLYSAAVAAHDAARPCCIGYLSFNLETCEVKLLLWQRYRSFIDAYSELLELGWQPTYGPRVFETIEEFQEEAARLYEPPYFEE